MLAMGVLGTVRLVAAGLAVVAMSAFWSQRFDTYTLAQGARRASLEFPRPRLLNGFMVRFDRGVNRPIELPTSAGARSIVFFVADSCAVCAQQVAMWASLINRADFLPTDRIILISFGGSVISSELASLAQSRNIEAHEALVLDPILVGQRTGVAWTPQLMLLDSAMRLRGSAQALNDRTIEDFLELLSELDQEVVARGGSR